MKDNAVPGPWGKGMTPWSKELEAALKRAFAEHVKALQGRLRSQGKGAGQEELAEFIGSGVAQSVVSQWINAKSLPKPRYLHAMARIAGVSPGALLDLLYVGAGAMPEDLVREDDRLLSPSDRFSLMCESASDDQMLEFQKIWLEQVIQRRQGEVEE